MISRGGYRRLGTFGRFGVEMCRGLAEHWRRGDASYVDLPRRVLEQWALLLGNGITAANYYAYGLHRASVSWKDKQAYIGDFDRWRWQLTANALTYRFVTGDKLVFCRYMTAVGVPLPRFLGAIGPGGRAETGESLESDSEVRTWLEDKAIQDVVLKPACGGHGAGVLVLGQRLHGTLQWERVPSGHITCDELLAHIRSLRPDQPRFIVQERLRPHPCLAVFSPDVVHTARVLTLLDSNVEILLATLRIGLGHSPVDNFSRGNLAAPIELNTGRLGKAVLSRDQSLVRLATHPVTGAPIEGGVIPDWEEALAALRTAAMAVPFDPLLAWDVAFSSRGPVVIEANDTWDVDLIQIPADTGLYKTPLGDYLKRRGLTKYIGVGLARGSRTMPRSSENFA